MMVRALHDADSAQVINLILPIQQLEFGVPISLEGQPDLVNIDGFYYRDGGGFWGIEIDGRVVGSIALKVSEGPIATIRKMFVAKEYRGKELGIATLLLETLLARCRELGIRHVYLGTVELLKAAHRFYERNGFERIAVEALPESFPRMLPDDVFYHLELL